MHTRVEFFMKLRNAKFFLLKDFIKPWKSLSVHPVLVCVTTGKLCSQTFKPWGYQVALS